MTERYHGLIRLRDKMSSGFIDGRKGKLVRLALDVFIGMMLPLIEELEETSKETRTPYGAGAATALAKLDAKLDSTPDSAKEKG